MKTTRTWGKRYRMHGGGMGALRRGGILLMACLCMASGGVFGQTTGFTVRNQVTTHWNFNQNFEASIGGSSGLPTMPRMSTGSRSTAHKTF